MINTELERKYLDTNDFIKNENGRYIYANRNGEHIVDLESILEDYYSWRKTRNRVILDTFGFLLTRKRKSGGNFGNLT